MFIHSLVLLISCAFSQVQSGKLPVVVSVEQLKDVSHIEFSGRDLWDYKLSREGEGVISVEVDRIDDKSLVLLKTFQSAFIEKVDVESGVNSKNKILFYLKNKQTQSFDYVTDQPSRLVVDFYNDEVKMPNVEKQKEAANKKTAKLPSKKNRNPAGVDFLIQDKKTTVDKVTILDGADPNYSRFQIQDYEVQEAAIIASKLNLYIEFPMMKVPFYDLAEILKTPNQYEIPNEDAEENKKARLLLTLFNKGQKDSAEPEKITTEKPRHAVFLKTLELFKKEYPESKYNEVLSFMEADTYYNLWLKNKNISDFEVSMSLYSKILLSIKSSKYHDRTMRLVAFSYFDKGDYLNAYTNLQRYLNKTTDTTHKYRVQIAMADCLAKLDNTNDALKIYNEIEDDKNSSIYGIESAFRKGDIYAQTKEYDRAIAEYEKAQKKFTQYELDYPNAFYNIAESKFWRKREAGNLKESLNGYIEFIKKFPKNEHASYAMERIGELLEMLGAPEKRFNGAFNETIYRYGETQAAGIAKIRMLRARIPAMKDRDIQDEVAKINTFIKSSKLEKLKEFKTIMISDGYYADKNYDEALKNLITFYQENPLSQYLDVFKKRIVKTIKDQMAYSVANNDSLKTFQIYGKNASVWLKNSDRIDIDFLLGKAFEKSGVPDEALKKYQYALNRLYAIRGTQEEKERLVFESLPGIDEVNLRIANVLIGKSEYGRAQDHLKETSAEKLAAEDDKIERVYLYSLVNEKLGNNELAMKNLKDLTTSWRGNPEKLSNVYIRLAKLQFDGGEAASAITTLDQLLEMSKDSSVISDEDQMETFKTRAKFAESIKKFDVATSSYRALLDRYEEKYPLYSSRYHLGKIYYDQKNYKEAEKIWSPLQDKPDAQIWSRLASENLKNSNWNDEYKKYTNRIPAMATEKSEKGDKK